MKKIRITESELISLIEKMVKENMGAIPSLSAQGGGFANLGMAKPTDKYKDLYEDGDLENVDEDDATTGSDELQLSVTNEPDVEDGWTGRNPSTNMESIVNRLKKKLSEGKCPKSGCTKKVGDNWRVISNKTGKLWDAEYSSEEDAKSAIEAYHANVEQ